QYAHARICTVLKQLADKGGRWDRDTAKLTLHRLSNEHEKALLTLLNRYPEMLERASAAYTPHTLVYFLKDLAEALHSYYNTHRFLVEDDPELQSARLALIQAVGQVIRNGLGILGVSAPERM
ncbi:MAG TPA: DALR anticodon-binding domain-containing protein, partial [Fontimonas sp.]